MGEKKLEPYMTIDQAAEYMGMSARTLRRRVSQKMLRAYKPGKMLFFTKADLDIFIKRFPA